MNNPHPTRSLNHSDRNRKRPTRPKLPEPHVHSREPSTLLGSRSTSSYNMREPLMYDAHMEESNDGHIEDPDEDKTIHPNEHGTANKKTRPYLYCFELTRSLKSIV